LQVTTLTRTNKTKYQTHHHHAHTCTGALTKFARKCAEARNYRAEKTPTGGQHSDSDASISEEENTVRTGSQRNRGIGQNAGGGGDHDTAGSDLSNYLGSTGEFILGSNLDRTSSNGSNASSTSPKAGSQYSDVQDAAFSSPSSSSPCTTPTGQGSRQQLQGHSSKRRRPTPTSSSAGRKGGKLSYQTCLLILIFRNHFP
jgi:hypothetical protein